MSVTLLSECKTHLGITSTTHDARLQRVLNSAERIAADIVGPLSPIPVTKRAFGGTDTLVLTELPVESVTSITDASGSAVTATYSIEGEYGILTRTDGSTWPAVCVVTYNQGFTTVPEDIELAVFELARHLWQPARGPFASGNDAQATVALGGYVVPRAVAEIFERYPLALGFA